MRRVAVIAAVSLCLATASQPAQADSRPTAIGRPVAPSATGAAITQVQTVLRSYGYTVAVDGILGPQTKRAVRHWQQSNGLPANGIVDAVTLATLRPAVRVDPPAPPPAVDRSPEQIIRDVWPDDVEDRAVSIAFRESRLTPTARNACCFGLFQINYAAHRSWLAAGGVTSAGQLLDADTNARVALALYQAAGWAPWSL